MCGSATFAIVVSSACMIDASITETVMAARRPATFASPMVDCGSYCARRRSVRFHHRGLCLAAENAATKFGVDFDVGAQSHLQRHFRIALFDFDAHRQTLHDFHPVSGGVFGGKRRELRARARAHADDTPL